MTAWLCWGGTQARRQQGTQARLGAASCLQDGARQAAGAAARRGAHLGGGLRTRTGGCGDGAGKGGRWKGGEKLGGGAGAGGGAVYRRVLDRVGKILATEEGGSLSRAMEDPAAGAREGGGADQGG